MSIWAFHIHNSRPAMIPLRAYSMNDAIKNNNSKKKLLDRPWVILLGFALVLVAVALFWRSIITQQ